VTYRRQAELRRDWFKQHGIHDFYTCDPIVGCGEPVGLQEFILHHRNENQQDNRLSNVAVLHTACHTRHHDRVGTLKRPR
jgi:hypothetical protein